jgi:hypothetical protein
MVDYLRLVYSERCLTISEECSASIFRVKEDSSTENMEAAYSSIKIAVNVYQTTQHYIPEDNHIN